MYTYDTYMIHLTYFWFIAGPWADGVTPSTRLASNAELPKSSR